MPDSDSPLLLEPAFQFRRADPNRDEEALADFNGSIHGRPRSQRLEYDPECRVDPVERQILDLLFPKRPSWLALTGD